MGFLKKMWALLSQPSGKPLGVLLVVGILVGAIGFATFHFTLNFTSATDFCISCHEMQWVYEEYQESPHYNNPSGVRASCADCHVPEGKYPGGYVDKVIAKIVAFKDIYHHILGTYGTREKFDKGRYHLAEKVWNRLKANDSEQCRKCHDFKAMDLSEQDRLASRKHRRAMEEGETCISCHIAVAHEEPVEPDEEPAKE